MNSEQFAQRRGQIEEYFDRTANEAWAKLTSDAPVSKIRETVRAGRNRMRDLLLGWLPTDLRGQRVLDAGCGTGAGAVELAARGAEVCAVDISPRLIAIAQERVPQGDLLGRIEFRSGDFAAAELGEFDHVLAMDSLIHYRTQDAVDALGALAGRTRGSIVFTFAPRTPMLAVMHATGRLFPRSDRAPSIVPTAEGTLRRAIERQAELADWECRRDQRVVSGFYTSHAQEIHRR